MRTKDLGFTKEHVLKLGVRGTNILSQREAFKDRLLSNPNISSISFTSATPGVECTIVPYTLEGSDENKNFPSFFVDYDFLETFDIQLINGRNFSEDIFSDLASNDSLNPAGGAFILNESAAKSIGGEINEVIGSRLTFAGINTMGEVIGVVKDFSYESLHKQAGPVIVALWPNWFDRVFVRLHSNDVRNTLQYLASVWNEFEAERPFNYYFLDDDIDALYRNEDRVGYIISLFSVLAIIISCLGILGLASFMANKRRKEIGIRKVLGASTLNISGLLTKEFVVLILFANMIAWPIAYLAMKKWLEYFAYRINIGISIFLLAGVSAIIIAVLTISYQAIKAARANPIEAIQQE
jgi:putative ABC transport system permease protein